LGGVFVSADPPLDQRIEQPERFLAERPYVGVIEIPAPFLDMEWAEIDFFSLFVAHWQPTFGRLI
jgi:hypothetical protein